MGHINSLLGSYPLSQALATTLTPLVVGGVAGTYYLLEDWGEDKPLRQSIPLGLAALPFVNCGVHRATPLIHGSAAVETTLLKGGADILIATSSTLTSIALGLLVSIVVGTAFDAPHWGKSWNALFFGSGFLTRVTTAALMSYYLTSALERL